MADSSKKRMQETKTSGSNERNSARRAKLKSGGSVTQPGAKRGVYKKRKTPKTTEPSRGKVNGSQPAKRAKPTGPSKAKLHGSQPAKRAKPTSSGNANKVNPSQPTSRRF